MPRGLHRHRERGMSSVVSTGCLWRLGERAFSQQPGTPCHSGAPSLAFRALRVGCYSETACSSTISRTINGPPASCPSLLRPTDGPFIEWSSCLDGINVTFIVHQNGSRPPKHLLQPLGCRAGQTGNKGQQGCNCTCE